MNSCRKHCPELSQILLESLPNINFLDQSDITNILVRQLTSLLQVEEENCQVMKIF